MCVRRIVQVESVDCLFRRRATLHGSGALPKLSLIAEESYGCAGRVEWVARGLDSEL
jgi:hypothetical protein